MTREPLQDAAVGVLNSVHSGLVSMMSVVGDGAAFASIWGIPVGFVDEHGVALGICREEESRNL